MQKTVLAIFLVFVMHATAPAFEVEVIPGSVYIGDAFMVRVTGVSEKPLGVYEGGWLNFGPCGEGCFVAIGAVDLDDSPGNHGIAISVEDQNKKLSMDVLSKEFPVAEITLQPDKVTLSAEDEKRVKKETEKLQALWRKATPKFWQGEFIIPVENSFSTVFGVNRIMNSIKKSVHTGLDIRGKTGEPVKAANRGKVVVAEDLFYGGNTIVLDHGQGIYSYYMHLSKFRAKVGDVVEKGGIIGDVGATGRATGPHLHFGIKVSETNANPVSVTKLPLNF